MSAWCLRVLNRRLALVWSGCVVAVVWLGLHEAPAGADEISFNRDIRPILSDNCYLCHGFDAGTRKADLRLDTFAGATQDREGVTAIKPGDLEASEVWARVNEEDPTLVMPPPSTKKTLTALQKEKLRKWIEQGAKYEGHWSLIAPVRPGVSASRFDAQVRTPIDSFVFARLEREGLAPAEPADKATLLRRVTLDVTGLPPTLDELDTFLADDSPDAYEKQVDRLFASPRYGEHLASWWCDAARYADTNGFQNDFFRDQWRWRDWVIGAFNRNLPFDQFTIEQLAGDLLPTASLDQQIATGFHRNNRTVTEAGSLPEEWRTEYVIDRVETTAAVWMGLTLGCCRCHDHKYDPFSQKDFYQLSAFFNSIAEQGVVLETPGNTAPKIKAPLPEHSAKLAELERTVETVKREVAPILEQADVDQVAWELKTASEPAATDESVVWRAPLAGSLAVQTASGNADAKWIGDDPAAWETGELGVSLALAGKTGPRVEVPESPAAEGTRPFSIAAWVYLPAAKNAATIISCLDESSAPRGWELVLTGRPTFRLTNVDKDDALKVTAKRELPAKTWQHVAVTTTARRKP